MKHILKKGDFDRSEVKALLQRQQANLISRIEEVAAQIDCESAFIALATTQLLSKSGEGGYKDAEHGMIPSLIELGAFYLYPHFGNQKPRNQEYYSHLFDALGELNSLRGLNTALMIDSSDPALAKLQTRLQLYAESVRGSSYPHQIRCRIENIQTPHDEWFKSQVGIGPLRALEFLECVQKIANINLSKHNQNVQEFVEKMLSLGGRMDDLKHLTLESERVSLGDELNTINENYLEISAVSFNQVNQMICFSIDEWQAMADLVGITKEIRPRINHPRELRNRPVYFLDKNRLLFVDLGSVLDALFEAFDDLTRKNLAFRDSHYVPRLGKWMELETFRCFRRVFPASAIFASLVYPDPNQPKGEAEVDGAILWGPFLILCEVKGKQFSPRSRLGDPGKLRSDLKRSIEEAFEQACRAIRYIDSQQVAKFKELHSGRELVVRKSKIHSIFPVSVTLHHFGGLATQLAMLKRLGLFKTNSYPWSLALADLDTITRFAGTPDVFLHYVQRRIELQKSEEEFLGEELDLFGSYLDCRLHPGKLWGRPPEEDGAPRMFGFTGGSERFDEWYQVEAGLKKERPDIKLELPKSFLDILSEARRRTEEGATLLPIALLNLSNTGVATFVEALEKMRENTRITDRMQRFTFKEDDFVVSIIAAKNSPLDVLEYHTAKSCELEKYRLKASQSLAIGIRLENSSKPFDCACLIDEPWVVNSELDAILKAERPRILLGQRLPGRNERCLCGSGKKFKKCCMDKIKR